MNSALNNASSNNDSDDNVGSSEDRNQRDQQHGHFAETGFAAEASVRASAKKQDPDRMDSAQNAVTVTADDTADDTVPVGQSGVLGHVQIAESSGRHKGSSDESKKGQKGKRSVRDTDATSGDNAGPGKIEAPGSPAQSRGRSLGLPKIKASAVTDAETDAADGRSLATRKQASGKTLRRVSQAVEGIEMRGSAPDAAKDQSNKAPQSTDVVAPSERVSSKDSDTGVKPAAATSSGASRSPTFA